MGLAQHLSIFPAQLPPIDLPSTTQPSTLPDLTRAKASLTASSPLLALIVIEAVAETGRDVRDVVHAGIGTCRIGGLDYLGTSNWCEPLINSIINGKI